MTHPKPVLEYVAKTVTTLLDRYIPSTINDFIPLLVGVGVTSGTFGALATMLVYSYSQKSYPPNQPKSTTGDRQLKEKQAVKCEELCVDDGWFDPDMPRTFA